MKSGFLRSAFTGVALLGLASCDSDPVAPLAAELLPVTVTTRAIVVGETIPAFFATGGAGAVSVRVARQALCITQVEAHVARGVGEMSIVAHSSSTPNSLADCAPPGQFVAEYQGTVSNVAAGVYRVYFYDGNSGEDAVLLGHTSVNVTAPASVEDRTRRP